MSRSKMFDLDAEKTSKIIELSTKTPRDISLEIGAGKNYVSDCLHNKKMSSKYFSSFCKNLHVEPEFLLAHADEDNSEIAEEYGQLEIDLTGAAIRSESDLELDLKIEFYIDIINALTGYVNGLQQLREAHEEGWK